jgi:hypothetical protein
MVTDEQQWYIQKGARIQGPFSTNEVGRFLLLGRVRNTDRVSRDGELWEPVTQVPELIPEELLDLDTDHGWNRFLGARAVEDERREQRQVADERRNPKTEITEELRDEWLSDGSSSDGPKMPAQSVLPWSLLGITLAALGVMLYLNSTTGIAG